MNISQNRRYQETEQKIADAFDNLISTKDYDSISVQDICYVAHISRPSFYSHYDDINDLIIKMEQNKSAHIHDILIDNHSITEATFAEYFKYLKSNRAFYLAFFHQNKASSVSTDMMNRYSAVNHLTLTPTIKCNMLFFMGGLRAIAYDWLINNCTVPISEIAHAVFKIYYHSDFGVSL